MHLAQLLGAPVGRQADIVVSGGSGNTETTFKVHRHALNKHATEHARRGMAAALEKVRCRVPFCLVAAERFRTMKQSAGGHCSVSLPWSAGGQI